MARQLSQLVPEPIWRPFSRLIRPRGEPQGDEEKSRAYRWLTGAITAWESDGRITAEEARDLQLELARPDFLAVLPHFGVHLAIGVMMRFPVGSITRATYTLLNLLLVTFLWVTRKASWERWRQVLSIHSPLVILIAAVPGIGTFSYLASKPFRSNHLLLRVSLDAVLLKLPWRVYERTGLRWINARPRTFADAEYITERAPLRLNVWAQSVVLVLGLIVVALFALDVLSKIADLVLQPDVPGWVQVRRILDLGAEASIGTWYAVAALIFLSALIALVGFMKSREHDRFTRHWFVLAFLTLGISLDEQAKFHDAGDGTEELREMLGMGGVLYYGWVIVGLLSALVVALAYRRFVTNLPQATRRLFILAAALFVAGEVGFEMVSGWYTDAFGQSGRYDVFVVQILTSVEEFLGMAGVFVATAAMLHYLQTYAGEIRVALSDTSSGLDHHEADPDPFAQVPAATSYYPDELPVSTRHERVPVGASSVSTLVHVEETS